MTVGNGISFNVPQRQTAVTGNEARYACPFVVHT